MNKDFNHSYWETRQYFSPYDLIVVGAGIVGLSTAIAFKTRNRKAKVLVIERGLLPEGASTKNAGFACFGTAGELLDDLTQSKNTDLVWETVKMRWEGLGLLRKRLGDKALDYKAYGGHELFFSTSDFEGTRAHLQMINQKVYESIGIRNCYSPTQRSSEGFKQLKGRILNKHEGQIDTGKMMTSLELLARNSDIRILNNTSVNFLQDLSQKVVLATSAGDFEANKVAVATNGFARQLLQLDDFQPARAQVLVTSPINGLKIKGCYHFDKGYYYFRNIDNRILFGGGRNLDLKTENTSEFGLNPIIQKQLEYFLRENILPGISFQTEQRWSGIMGMGHTKKPVLKKVSPNVLAAVRMGGMGIAIGSKIAELAAKELG